MSATTTGGAETGRRPVRVAVVGLGYWGPNLVRNLYELPEAEVAWACDLRPEALARSARRYPAVPRTTRLRRRARGPSVDAVVDRDTGLDALTSSRSQRSRPASTSWSRSHSPASSEEALGADRRPPPTAGLVLMPGHTFLYSPPVTLIRDLIDARRAGRDLLHLHEPRESRDSPARRQRRLGPRAARLLDPPLLARRAADRRSPRSRGAASCRTRPDVAFIHLGSGRGRSRMSSSRGSPRASCAGRRSSARRRWSSTTTPATSPSGSSTPAPTCAIPQTFGEYQLTYRTGDIVSPKVAATEPLALQLADFCKAIRNGTTPRSSARSGWMSCAIIEAVDRSLALSGRPVRVDMTGQTRPETSRNAFRVAGT